MWDLRQRLELSKKDGEMDAERSGRGPPDTPSSVALPGNLSQEMLPSSAWEYFSVLIDLAPASHLQGTVSGSEKSVKSNELIHVETQCLLPRHPSLPDG